jgi:hypothetical protein
MNLPFSNMQFLGFSTFAVILGVIPMVLWLVIGWRAMRAHEDIATSLDSLTRHIRLRDEQIPPGGDNRKA